MKISNLKKYILFIIISFIVITNKVMADELPIDIEFGGSPLIIDSNEYLSLSCSPQGTLNALTLNQLSNGDYSISFDKRPTTSGTDVIVCNWEGRNAVGHEETSGQHTYRLSYNVIGEDELRISLNGSLDNGIPQANVIERMQNAHNLKNVSIVRVTPTSDGNELVNVSGCSGTRCIVTPTDEALSSTEVYEVTFDFTYTSDASPVEKVMHITFTISFTGGVRLFPGGVGVCDFSGGIWQFTQMGGYQYYQSTTSGTVNLPTCEPKKTERVGDDITSDYLTFAGWVHITPEMMGHRENFTVGACEGAVNGSISGASGGNYIACFNRKDGIQLVVDSTSSIDPVGTCRLSGSGTYFCEGDSSFTLPNVTQEEGVVSSSRKFLGWSKDGSGTLLNPGDSVSTTEYGIYYAKYETTTTEVDRYKSVYVGQNSFLSVDGMVSCSVSANEFLNATMSTNECLISGLKATADRQFIDVLVGIKDEDGSERAITYKFQVRNNNNGSEANNGTFVIDVDARIEAGENNSYALNDFDHIMCDRATISNDGAAELSMINDSKHLTSNNYKATPTCSEMAGKTYFALCMDPGRSGPHGDVYDITERISPDSDVGRMVGMIINLINTETSPTAFDDPNNSVRIAAHVAIRTVILINGYSGSVDYTDSVYEDYYVHYVNLATALNNVYDRYDPIPKPGDSNYDTYRSEIEAAVDSFGIDDSAARGYAIDLFANYKNYEVTESGSFQRTIDSHEVNIIDDNSYNVVYKGTFTLPVNTHLTMTNTSNYQYFSKPGVTGTLVSLTKNIELSTDDPAQEVYDYEVRIDVTDASSVQVPQNPQEELEYSLKLPYTGGIDFSSVRIANPLANSAAKQRMIIFDLENTEATIYFNINLTSDKCSDIEALNYETCLSEDSCDINKSLFKASGCCREILDEKTYSYLINNVCNGSCAVSTMSNVCSYDPNYTGSVDLYEVKEGAYYNGTPTEPEVGADGTEVVESTTGRAKYDDAIGTCIVNVKGNYAQDYRDGILGTDTYSSHGTPTENDDDNYQKYDEKGNSIMVASYQGNQYCQISCREDWTFTMGAFGNFVGKNAVLAGTFFQNHDNDIFIEASRTCYTTYLDYELFMKDLVEQSQLLVEAYNNYSNASHAYSDVKKQIDDETYLKAKDDSIGFEFHYNPDQCVEYEWVEPPEDDPDAEGYWSCSKKNSELDEPYGYYSLDLDHKFKEEDDDGVSGLTGEYYRFSLDVGGDGTSSPIKSSEPHGKDTTYTHNEPTGDDDTTEDSGHRTNNPDGSYSITRTDDDGNTTTENYNSGGALVNENVTNSSGTTVESYDGSTGVRSYYNNDGDLTETYNENTGAHTTYNSEGGVASSEKIEGGKTAHEGSCTWPSDPTAGASSSSSPIKVTPTGTRCYADNDTNRKKGIDELGAEMMGEDEAATNKEFQKMSAALNQIVTKYEHFWKCQHFELNNTTDDRNGKKNNDTTYARFMGATKAFVQIATQFDPYISYMYDESVYMTILQDDNILVEYDELNNSFFDEAGEPEDYGNSTNVQVDAKVGFTDRCRLNGDSDDCEPTEPTDVKLSRNKLSFSYYNPDGPWVDDELVRTYGGDTADVTLDVADSDAISSNPSLSETKRITLCSIGRVGTGTVTVVDEKDGLPRLVNTSERVPDWEGGKCYNYDITYLKSHYIKASITNSSFYRNKGIWYTGPNDTREHGDTLEEAWANALKRGGPTYSNENKEDWSVFAGSKIDDNIISLNLNIFPISMTTARNLYQYTYEFTQIGSYTDERLGRIMGDASSIIGQNRRTCFYEVVENVCLCCGDPIVSYTEVDVITPQEFVDSSGYRYDFNQEVPDDARQKGNLSILVSPVAVSDLNGSTNRELGNNWTDKGSFIYGNDKLNTNKGAVAWAEIESRGETVYLNESLTGSGSTAPEYSFELNPAALAAIRNYNDMYGYQVDFSNLKLYGRSSIQPLGSCTNPETCKWFPSGDEENEEMTNKIANFGHYGSIFLEQFDEIVGVSGAANPSNISNLDGDDNVCAIVRNDSVDTALSDLNSNINSGKCRWIDYIEIADDVKTLWSDSPTTQYYRLAFK